MHYLTEEHLMVREMIRSFALKELKPIAAKIDEEDVFPEFVFHCETERRIAIFSPLAVSLWR